ncbi:GNAT family N-acetyltransferase [Asanoa sp. WMMD1127]|uniref:GNAT family N-acetyltransferase n=1 Tax=Asanoa sp. WMMD1127 TaxID=3016107 RepID=UPI002416AEEE|nr:GNAT family N-acetyltransferase [Asanoa sp. WMMD1127]MDG4825606.1 GNAT family N-acetyltransferase [Asanoa sp. WMMD1127]
MTVAPFHPGLATPADLAAWAAVFSDGQLALAGSSASADEVARRLSTPDGARRWAARSSEGRIVGVASLSPQPHDRSIGFLRLFVAPQARRRGIGSALLAAVRAEVAGLRAVQSTVLAGPPGEPFARTHAGLRVLLRLELQRQPVDAPDTLRRCREIVAVPPDGYTLRHWSGPAPEAAAAGLGTVLARVRDAPGAVLQLPDRHWDPAAVRAWEAELTAGGARLLVGAATHRGEVVAATALTVPAAGGPLADQHDTAVLPAHRGRGLARWIKADQTLRLAAAFPAVRAVTVTVNQDNGPMLAVNRAVGYRRSAERLLLEAPLA